MRATLLGMLMAAGTVFSETIFEERFDRELQAGWVWVREDPKSWRLADRALEIRVEPGNMWGGENSGKNVLVRDLPQTDGTLEISALFENRPTEQYEQVDLVAYYSDSNQVKIGQELVDGQLSIVMGREERDRTRTIAIIPLKTPKVEVKWVLEGRNLTGKFRPDGAKEWSTAGGCDLPGEGRPRIAIQCYQGPREKERWARISDFRIVKGPPSAAGTPGTKR